jgi:SNF2 family DNA or RNA helicase
LDWHASVYGSRTGREGGYGAYDDDDFDFDGDDDGIAYGAQEIISDRRLKQLGGSAYYRAYEVISSGRMHDMSVADDEETPNGLLLSAYVDSADGYSDDYEVSVVVNEQNDEVSDADCTCPAFGRYGAICKHVIAVIMQYNEDSGLFELQGGPLRRSPTQNTTRLLKTFMGKQDREMQEQARKRHLALLKTVNGEAASAKKRPTAASAAMQHMPIGSVALRPTIGRSMGAWYLRLRIAAPSRSASYVIKDIGSLLQSVRQNEPVTYGKKLAFVHTIDSFDERSRRMLAVLGRAVDIRRSVGGVVRRSMSSETGGGDMTLSDDEIADILDLYVEDAAAADKAHQNAEVFSRRTSKAGRAAGSGGRDVSEDVEDRAVGYVPRGVWFTHATFARVKNGDPDLGLHIVCAGGAKPPELEQPASASASASLASAAATRRLEAALSTSNSVPSTRATQAARAGRTTGSGSAMRGTMPAKHARENETPGPTGFVIRHTRSIEDVVAGSHSRYVMVREGGGGAGDAVDGMFSHTQTDAHVTIYRCSEAFYRNRKLAQTLCGNGEEGELFLAQDDVEAFSRTVLPFLDAVEDDAADNAVAAEDHSKTLTRAGREDPVDGRDDGHAAGLADYGPVGGSAAKHAVDGANGVGDANSIGITGKDEDRAGHLHDGLRVRLPAELLQSKPEPCQIEIYLDRDRSVGGITCDVQARYGEQRFHVFDGIPADGVTDGVARDRQSERLAVEAVRHYFPMPQGNIAFLPENNDEAIYKLISEGLPVLRSLGSVFSTPSFDGLTSAPRPNIKVGLSLRSGLVEISPIADEIDPDDVPALLNSYRKRRRFHRLRNGAFIDMRDVDAGAVDELASDLGLSASAFEKGSVTVPAYEAYYLDHQVDDADKSEGFKDYLDELRVIDPKTYQVPESLREVLRPYQAEGFRWLSAVCDKGFGGILADEMGLGKTVQLLSLLVARREESRKAGPSLIVCPASLVYNWAAECERFAPELNVLAVAGNKASRRAMLDEAKAQYAGIAQSRRANAVAGAKRALSVAGDGIASDGNTYDRDAYPAAAADAAASNDMVFGETAGGASIASVVDIAGAGDADDSAASAAGWQGARTVPQPDRIDRVPDVLITSYDLLRRDIADYRGLECFCMVLDEAQYIKNHATKASRAVRSVNARHRFALTGTPIENRLSELWSIFDFLMPGILGSYAHFRERFEMPILSDDEEAQGKLQAFVGPFILRRLKADVLKDLPDKIENVIAVPLEGEQRHLYAALEQRLRATLLKQRDIEFATGKIQILAQLTRLRQACCDPRLLYSNVGENEVEANAKAWGMPARTLEESQEATAKRELAASASSTASGRKSREVPSAKLDAIEELVSSCQDAGRKMLIFSQFTSYLDLIAERLRADGVNYDVITGATLKKRRVELVDQFNRDDTPVFLISLKAGNTGLNLTGACVVVHADPWWNAAAQDQATDRAHRIGQTQDVNVYQIVAKDTIEERILALQQSKSDLASRFVDSASSSGAAVSRLTKDDLLALLG